MIHELGKYRKDIKFLVNDILTSLTPFKKLIPINKHGLILENILRLEKLFESNNCIVIFQLPYLKTNKIKDLEWRKHLFYTKYKHHISYCRWENSSGFTELQIGENFGT